MSVMNKPDYKIFAQDAKSGEYVAFPDILRGWGITLDQYNGFPPMELFNSAAKRIDEWLMYLTQRGLPEWDAAVDYPKDAMIHHAGVYYVSLKVTKGEQPNNSQASWKRLTEFLGVDGKLAKDQNGADIPNKNTFISNLGLGEAAKSGISHTTGTSKTNVMSQDGVTKALNGKLDKTGGVLTGNDNVITIRNSGANRANFIQGENNQENAEWMVGRLGLGSDVSLYSAVHGLSIAIRSDGAYVNNDKIMAGVVSLLDDRGYIKFGDSGLILQWGLTPNPIGGESVDLSFPIPFPTKCLGGIVTPTGSSGDAGFLTSWFHILSRSGFRLTNARTGTTVKYSFYWFAWGK